MYIHVHLYDMPSCTTDGRQLLIDHRYYLTCNKLGWNIFDGMYFTQNKQIMYFRKKYIDST